MPGPSSDGRLHIFVDVDHTIVVATPEGPALRPHVHHALARLRAAGHALHLWSAGGAAYCATVAERYGLHPYLEGCHDKDPRVVPRPDFIVDDDAYLVSKYGGYAVAPYRAVDPDDRAFLDLLAALEELGHL